MKWTEIGNSLKFDFTSSSLLSRAVIGTVRISVFIYSTLLLDNPKNNWEARTFVPASFLIFLSFSGLIHLRFPKTSRRGKKDRILASCFRKSSLFACCFCRTNLLLELDKVALFAAGWAVFEKALSTEGPSCGFVSDTTGWLGLARNCWTAWDGTVSAGLVGFVGLVGFAGSLCQAEVASWISTLLDFLDHLCNISSVSY